MKIVILYHPKSEQARAVDEYVREFGFRNPDVSLELKSVDEKNGAQFAELYGIVSYPAMLAVGDDGQMAKLWDGEHLPLMNEVAYFAFGQ